MSILDLNIHAWKEGQATKVTKFIVAFFFFEIYFNLLKNKIPGQALIRTQMLIQLRSKIQFWIFIKTFSTIDRIIKMQIFDELHHYDLIISGYEKSL